MFSSLKFASLLTLGILSGFVFTILAVAAFFLGEIDGQFLILLTIGFNFLMWVIGPFINDFMMRYFYKMQFYSFEELTNRYPDVAGFLQRVSEQNNINVPKVGIIDDDNPTAFTYGSLPSNARIVFTKGLFTYLDKEEREAVLAHEVGHIVHYDFVIMTIASTLVQILYEIYVIFRGSKSGGSDEKRKGPFALIALLSYIFYFIGTYVVMYLSRVREYYADEFSGRTTGNPNALSAALIKIGYGIIAKQDNENSSRLMTSTRAWHIGYQNSKGIGLDSAVLRRFRNDKQGNGF